MFTNLLITLSEEFEIESENKNENKNIINLFGDSNKDFIYKNVTNNHIEHDISKIKTIDYLYILVKNDYNNNKLLCNALQLNSKNNTIKDSDLKYQIEKI